MVPSMKTLIILAAGKGERLKPITETRPKPLVRILGRSLLCRHIKGIPADEIVIVANYLKDIVVDEARKCAGDSRLKIVEQGRELGTGHAVLKAVDEAEGDILHIVYGDVFLPDKSYRIISESKPNTVFGFRVPDPRWYGLLKMRDELLEEIVEKPVGHKGDGLIFTGIVTLDREIDGYLRALKPSPRGELEFTDALTALARISDVSVREIPGWIDVGKPWDLLRAVRLAMDLELKPEVHGEVAESAVIEGPVYVAPGAKIEHHTVIEGPAWIGPGARVGPHAHVRPYTQLDEGAYVGFSSQVKGSVFMEGARAPHLNYVGDSVLGEHVNLGAGTITANLRFDDKTVRVRVKNQVVDSGMRKLGAFIGGYAKTGINVSIMPGVKIGSRAVVYPGCRVDRDVPAGKVYKC